MELIMQKFELKEILEKGVVTVVFEKVDGTVREMKCTLLNEYIPTPSEPQLLTEQTPQVPRKENPGVLSVWDIENQGWRSFRVESVKEVRK